MNSDYSKKPLLLQVKNLSTSFQSNGRWVNVVNQVSFKLHRGETLGIIGESGCGKTVTSLSLMRLIPKPMGRIDQGEVYLEGKEILNLPIEDFRKLRGKEVSMIFQEPMTSLNPVLSIEKQVMEIIQTHYHWDYQKAKERATELIREVGISDPERRLKDYPHQLSGGMKQRIMIAIALACKPKLLIADEPTTALDVTIQAQILHLLKKVQEQHGMSMIMITHDLGVVAQTCDHVLVMYAGQVVEDAAVKELFQSPAHPYTHGLMDSILSIMETKDERLFTIPGMVPSLDALPKGCNFQNRCPHKTSICEEKNPELREVRKGHSVACFHPL